MWLPCLLPKDVSISNAMPVGVGHRIAKFAGVLLPSSLSAHVGIDNRHARMHAVDISVGLPRSYAHTR